MTTVAQLWKRLDSLLLEKAAPMYSLLSPPAHLADIDALERELQVTLPGDVRESYLCHGGQHFTDWNTPSFFAAHHWHNLERMREDWNWLSAFREERIQADGNADMWVQDDDSVGAGQKVRFDFWNPKWVPIAKNSTGTRLFVDLAPGPAGTAGQLVMWEPEGTDARSVVASGLTEHLVVMAEALERGWLQLSENRWWDALHNSVLWAEWPRETVCTRQ